MKTKIMLWAVALAAANPAAAGGLVVPVAFQVADETARYDQGKVTLLTERENGAVQLVPLPMDHGSVAFAVVVYNDGEKPAIFDSSNVTAVAGEQSLRAFTAAELASKAKTRALWSQIGVAILAGAAAAAVADAHTTETYRGKLRTPHGTYRWVSSYRDNSIGTAGAVAAVGLGAAGVASIQQRLDATLGMIGDDTIQQTTVDPASSYGGRIVLEKIKAKSKPRDVRVAVDWNGEQYKFGLHIPAKGDPVITPVRAADRPSRAAREVAAAPGGDPGAAPPSAPIIPVDRAPIVAQPTV